MKRMTTCPFLLSAPFGTLPGHARKDGTLSYLRPDGKTQVTVEYEDGKPVRIDTIVISAQHSPEITREQIEKDLLEFVIKPELPQGLSGMIRRSSSSIRRAVSSSAVLRVTPV